MPLRAKLFKTRAKQSSGLYRGDACTSVSPKSNRTFLIGIFTLLCHFHRSTGYIGSDANRSANRRNLEKHSQYRFGFWVCRAPKSERFGICCRRRLKIFLQFHRTVCLVLFYSLLGVIMRPLSLPLFLLAQTRHRILLTLLESFKTCDV